ncbi:MAG: inner membrane CreD family protein, partial [Pseudomonadota bacterium]|nr:inner membrane CreD family protein [Pseudomonadota bacterium]
MQRFLSLKILFMVGLTLAFLVSFVFMRSIVHERQSYYHSVIRDIARDSVRPQTLTTPFIIVPMSEQG